MRNAVVLLLLAFCLPAFAATHVHENYFTTDGNQFRDAATAYVASPEPL